MRYPGVADVIAMHQEIMTRYGQEPSLNENGEAALESALMRPRMAAYYEDTDLPKQAALLILGIAQAHPFVDGNKRAAFAAGIVTLQLNGYLVRSGPREFGQQIVGALTGATSPEALAEWIRANLQPL
jgi:death-on-curing protein